MTPEMASTPAQWNEEHLQSLAIDVACESAHSKYNPAPGLHAKRKSDIPLELYGVTRQ